MINDESLKNVLNSDLALQINADPEIDGPMKQEMLNQLAQIGERGASPPRNLGEWAWQAFLGLFTRD